MNMLNRLSQNKLTKFHLVLASLVTLLISTASQAASCQLEIEDQWNTGFKAGITINNEQDAPFSEWQLNWQLPEGARLNNSWNAELVCEANQCTAIPPSWNPTINTGNSYSFGFTANLNGASLPVEIVVNGDVCNGNSSGNNDNAPTSTIGAWILDGNASNVQYISTKKAHVAETNQFDSGDTSAPALSGSIDSSGSAILAIDLNDVATGIDIRNSRLLSLLFETELLPTAYFVTQVDFEAINAMAPGSALVQVVTGELILHGVRQPVATELLLVKTGTQQISVTSLKPILVNAADFDMASGIEALRLVANLSSISETVPVYLQLSFTAATDEQSIVSMPAIPAAPTGLAAQFNGANLETDLAWTDNANNESQYLVRRKAVDGDWQTNAELSANVTSISEGLPDTGEYDYKIIALNNGVPSNPSNIATVSVTQGNPIVRGQQLYQENCAGCHGVDGEGIASFPALNTERDLEQLIETIVTTMPYGNAAACDQDCAQDIAAYIQTLWISELVCDTTLTPVAYGARQLKLLTRFEYQNSVEDLIGIDFDAAVGLSEDNKVGFFLNNTHSAVTPASYSNHLLVAETIAQWSADRDFAPALSCGGLDQDCANQLVNELAPKIFRRPLTTQEQSSYLAIANGSQHGGDIKAGMQLALEGLLASPQFLYRHELGEANPDNANIDSDAFELTSYEMATFLAYTFTGSTPDQTLLQAAGRDELRDPTSTVAQAQRLVDQAHGVMSNFVGSWLGTQDLDLAAKDEQVWPGFAQLVPHMQEEMNQTFSYVMLQPDQSFASLYNGNFTFLNQPLAQHYGIDGIEGEQMRLVNTSDRGGILANGAFMARWAEAIETSPILRSVRVRRRMLCQEQPDPPAGTFAAREAKLAELAGLLQDPSTTNRLKYHRLTEDAPCTACHTQYINPLGFGMEDFDSVGRVRSTDLNGNNINASGELYAPLQYSDIDEFIPFLGTQGLGQVLSGLDSSQSCLPKQMFRYVMGLGHQAIDASNPEGPQLSELEQAGYACAIDDLTDTMMAESPRAMLELFSILDTVRYRKAWNRD